jgi:hypothetical protein
MRLVAYLGHVISKVVLPWTSRRSRWCSIGRCYTQVRAM